MPPHHPPILRQRCLARVANGEPVAVIAADEGVPEGTIMSWASRAKAKPAAVPRNAKPVIEDVDEDEDEDEPHELTELDRVEYLAASVGELDGFLKLAVQSKNYTALRGLMDSRSAHHKELVDTRRAEGSRLDLTDDPRVLAAQLQACGELIHMLTVELDGVTS